MSKSARKRAAKKRNANGGEAPAPSPKSTPAASANGKPKNGAEAPADVAEKAAAATTAAAKVVADNVAAVAEPTKPTPEDPQNAAVNNPPGETSLPLQRENSPPSSNSFKPKLPETLPHPASAQLPANRKRKTPQDFTPAGPGEIASAQSPNKNSVKFEDGVVPGEGKEGEKTIVVKEEAPVAEALGAPKKHQNAIERTVWTFIMIFGFIGGWVAFTYPRSSAPGPPVHDRACSCVPGFGLQGGH